MWQLHSYVTLGHFLSAAQFQQNIYIIFSGFAAYTLMLINLLGTMQAMFYLRQQTNKLSVQL